MSLEVFSNEFTIWVPTQNPLAGPCWLLFIFSWWQLFLWMASRMISLPSLQGLKVFPFSLWKHKSTLPTIHSFCLLSFLFVPEFYFCLFLTSSLQSVWSSCLPFLGSSRSRLWAVEWTRFSVLGITFHTHSSWSMCSGRIGFLPALKGERVSLPWPTIFWITPIIVIGLK